MKLKIVAVVFFLMLLGAGLWIASRKPLWNDELYSQVSSVQQSYAEIFLGRIHEGNNSPLFYVVQKAWLDALSYQTPIPWKNGDWGYVHPYSQVLLRVWPVACMSLSLTLIFYYFTRYYHFMFGAYALAISFSSFMVWAYGIETRPYALWFLLTTVQSLMVVAMIKKSTPPQVNPNWLLLVHVLLAFTAVLSIIQIAAVVVVLFLIGYRRSWFLGMHLIIPISIIGFYAAWAPHYKFFFKQGVYQLIGASLPLDRLLLLGAFVLFWLFQMYYRSGSYVELRRVTGVFVLWLGMVIVGNGVFLAYLKIHEQVLGSFQISNRYFIPLAPMGIIGVLLISDFFIKEIKGRWRLMVFFLLGFLLYWRILRTKELVGSLQLFS